MSLDMGPSVFSVSENESGDEASVPTTAEILSQSPIVVKVGPKLKELHVHKALLTHYSGYFKGTFRPGSTFKEAEDGVVVLDDVEPETFEDFVSFLYFKVFTPQTTALDEKTWWDSRVDIKSDVSASLRSLRLYAFADRFIVHALKEYMTVVVCTIFTHCAPKLAEVTYAYDNLPSDSFVLEVLIEAQTKYGVNSKDDGERKQAMDELPREFLYGVMEKMIEEKAKDKTAEKYSPKPIKKKKRGTSNWGLLDD